MVDPPHRKLFRCCVIYVWIVASRRLVFYIKFKLCRLQQIISNNSFLTFKNFWNFISFLGKKYLWQTLINSHTIMLQSFYYKVKGQPEVLTSMVGPGGRDWTLATLLHCHIQLHWLRGTICSQNKYLCNLHLQYSVYAVHFQHYGEKKGKLI